MNRKIFILSAVWLLIFRQPVVADLEVKFIESAPKDIFAITNISACDLEDLIVEIDLAQSRGQLIFDTTATGAGFQVYQPFEVASGGIELISSARVADGDTDLTLRIESIAAGKTASFTIDVDDRLTASELGKTRVAGSEISNGLVTARLMEQQPVVAVFGDDSKAIARLPACL